MQSGQRKELLFLSAFGIYLRGKVKKAFYFPDFAFTIKLK